MRNSHRQLSSMRGLIGIPGRRYQVECLVCDLSSTGARVDFLDDSASPAASTLPDLIVLALPSERVEILGRIRWRSTISFGIKFESKFMSSIRRFQSDRQSEALLDWCAAPRQKVAGFGRRSSV